MALFEGDDWIRSAVPLAFEASIHRLFGSCSALDFGLDTRVCAKLASQDVLQHVGLGVQVSMIIGSNGKLQLLSGEMAATEPIDPHKLRVCLLLLRNVLAMISSPQNDASCLVQATFILLALLRPLC